MTTSNSSLKSQHQPPLSLLDLTSLIVSQTYPFQLIEDRYKNIIPEPVQKQIIYHSFPKQESQVLVYASSDFNPDRYGVDQVVQIGFHVSGLVFEVGSAVNSKKVKGNNSSSRRASSSNNDNDNEDDNNGVAEPAAASSSSSALLLHHQPPPPPASNVFKVSATFDRGKITSVSCSCMENEHNNSSSHHHHHNHHQNLSLIFWCDHVIALSLHRIRKCTVGVDFVLRVPISETLLQLNRSQLQKLVQYLISDHTDVLPTAQRLADEILFMKTDDNFINRIHGAPDPTAGPSPQDPHSWALNESQIQSQVRQFLSTTTTTNATTSSSSSSTTTTQPSSTSPTNVIQILIEKIYKMIASRDSNAERILQIITNELVRHASKAATTATTSSRSSSTSPLISNSIWDQIIRIWNVVVLKPGITDQEAESLESVLTNLCKNESLPECEEYVPTPPPPIPLQISDPDEEDDDDDEDEDEDDEDSTSSSTLTKRQKLQSTYSSIFKTPLNLLLKKTNKPDYEVLRLHSKVCHNDPDTNYALQILSSLRNSKSASIRLENAHLLYNVLKQTQPREAYESALIGLTTPTVLKPTTYTHEKHLKLVEKLIGKLVSSGSEYPDVLRKYVENLLSDRRSQQPHGFPLISFASYVFTALHGSELAYKLALKHLNISDSNSFVHSSLEQQQITLATSLLTSAKDQLSRLDEITSTLIRVVKSNTNLFRLNQEVFKHASNENLVSVAFNIALHVVKATKYSVHRRRWEMVRWVVSCGVEIGVSKLFYLVRNWGEYFSAVEAVGSVASNILAWVGGSSNSVNLAGSSGSGNVSTSQQQCNERGCNSGSTSSSTSAGVSKLASVDVRILEELGNSARNLAIQCAKNDPQNCALNTLTLCESDPLAFETSYQIVLESASKEFLTPQQIFTIARYMEHRGYTQRAYRLAVIAVQHVHIGYNQDTHSLISEIHWTCNLSHQLSTPPHSHHHHHSSPSSHSIQTSSSASTSSSSSSRYSNSKHHQQSQQPPPSHHNNYHNYRLMQPPQQNQHNSNNSQTSSLLPPTTELENLIPLLIRNIKCATVLTEILRRSITIMTSYENAYHKEGRSSSNKKLLKQRVYEKLSLLIEGTIDSYITTTHSRLVHISPRHYSDFIEFLGKARENFLLAPNGGERFKHLVESMKCTYKGKKKLLFLLSERFG